MFLLWFRQGTFVYLLVLVQRNSIYLHGHSRNHIRWFLIENELIESVYVYLLVTDNVGSNKLTSTFLIKGLYGGILDTGELPDDTLHLFQLDAETTYLHLSVTATHKLDIARRKVTHYVARAINTLVFLVISESITDIDLCRLFGTVQITTAHLGARHPQFPSGTNRQTIALSVNNIKAHIVKWFAYGYLFHSLTNMISRCEDGTFRGTIHIIELIIRGRSQGGQLLTSR